jgi:hypothetical protein
VSPLKIKIPSKSLGMQRCAEGFKSDVKRLIFANIAKKNPARLWSSDLHSHSFWPFSLTIVSASDTFLIIFYPLSICHSSANIQTSSDDTFSHLFSTFSIFSSVLVLTGQRGRFSSFTLPLFSEPHWCHRNTKAPSLSSPYTSLW